MIMERYKYIEIRCPVCGRLIGRMSTMNKGACEFVCRCKNKFYTINAEVCQSPVERVKQIFNDKEHEISMV